MERGGEQEKARDPADGMVKIPRIRKYRADAVEPDKGKAVAGVRDRAVVWAREKEITIRVETH